MLVGLVALVVYALHGYHGLLGRDLGLFVYGGEHVARGTPPYVAMFNSVGPLADAVPGLAIWLGHLVGIGPILSSRLLFTALSAGCCALLCVLARDTLGSRTASFLAPAIFLTFEDFLSLASDGPREKTTMVLLMLGCLVLLGRRRWAAAGVCAALATLTWQPVLVVAGGSLVAAALLDDHDRRRRIVVRFLAGGAVVSLAAVAYFWAAGALTRAFDGFVVINVRYTHQPSPISAPGKTWTMLWNSYHASLLLAVAGLVSVLGLGLRAFLGTRRPAVSPEVRRLAVVSAGGLLATLWTLTAMNGPPDLFVVLPFAALGLSGAATRLLGHFPGRVALTGGVALVCLAVAVALVESVTTRDHRLDVQRADTAAVLGSLAPHALVLGLDAPQVLAISGRQNPTAYPHLSSTVQRYLDAQYPGGLQGFSADLRRVHPTVVALGSSHPPAWLSAWLTSDYVHIGGAVGTVWYIARSVGHATIRRAREAHHQVLALYGLRGAS